MSADWAGAAILAAVVASVFAGVAGLWAGAGAVVLAWGLLSHHKDADGARKEGV